VIKEEKKDEKPKPEQDLNKTPLLVSPAPVKEQEVFN
jgi:hypothetical protein